MNDITIAIKELRPNSSFGVRGSDIIWNDLNNEQPSEQEIQAKIAELKAAEPMRLLRLERNRRLAETDWMALNDVIMSGEWKTYRQALRDLPATAEPQLNDDGNLTNVTWPEVPK